MAIQQNKGMVGLGMPELGSLMWVGLQVDFTSIRSVVKQPLLSVNAIKVMNNQIVTILVLSLQDPGTPPARRIWRSIDMGTEIFVSDKDEVAEWTISDFDVTFT
jgi:hypothetical protein